MSNGQLCQLVKMVHDRHAHFRRCEGRFDADYQRLLADLDQLARDAAGNSDARDAIIHHCLKLKVSVHMLTQVFQVNAVTVSAIAASTGITSEPTVRYWKLMTHLHSATTTVVEWDDAKEQLAVALFTLATATLHDAVLRDSMISHCFQEGIPPQLIAKGFNLP